MKLVLVLGVVILISGCTQTGALIEQDVAPVPAPDLLPEITERPPAEPEPFTAQEFSDLGTSPEIELYS